MNTVPYRPNSKYTAQFSGEVIHGFEFVPDFLLPAEMLAKIEKYTVQGKILAGTHALAVCKLTYWRDGRITAEFLGDLDEAYSEDIEALSYSSIACAFQSQLALSK